MIIDKNEPLAHCVRCGAEVPRIVGYTINPPDSGSTFFLCSLDWDRLNCERAS